LSSGLQVDLTALKNRDRCAKRNRPTRPDSTRDIKLPQVDFFHLKGSLSSHWTTLTVDLAFR